MPCASRGQEMARPRIGWNAFSHSESDTATASPGLWSSTRKKTPLWVELFSDKWAGDGAQGPRFM
jgi:hypothetical protein